LTLVHGPAPRAFLRLVLALLALAATGALLLALAPRARADSNPNNLDCRGHIEAGDPAPGDDDQQVKYVFACSGPILGYQIQPQIGDTGFSSDASVFDLQGNPVTSDSFSCDGDFPGWGINCVGVYSGNYAKIVSQFSIATPLCDEPRVDPLLTVVYATANAQRVVTQAISGPYDLGRPHGCPKSAQGGKTRIPADGVFPIGGTEPTTTHKKTTKKKAAKKKAKKAARKRARARYARV
jgi:hypothetical protein